MVLSVFISCPRLVLFIIPLLYNNEFVDSIGTHPGGPPQTLPLSCSPELSLRGCQDRVTILLDNGQQAVPFVHATKAD